MRRLEGENRIEQFRIAAKHLTSRIVQLRGVEGIIYAGGLARGFADKYSDVDVIVFLSKRNRKLRQKIRKIGLAEQESSGIEIDLEIHYFVDFWNRELGEYLRWDLLNSRIVFDPRGRIKEVLRRETKVPKSFWKTLIIEYGEHLKWYCCQPRAGTPNLAEMWIERGDLVSAHYCLNYSVDLLLRLVFTLNKELLPSPKWIVHYSYGLDWLPASYATLLEEAMTVKSFSIDDLNRRLTAIRRMSAEIFTRIELETRLTPELIQRQYVKKILHQS